MTESVLRLHKPFGSPLNGTGPSGQSVQRQGPEKEYMSSHCKFQCDKGREARTLNKRRDGVRKNEIDERLSQKSQRGNALKGV
jgi:hypothetical protein